MTLFAFAEIAQHFPWQKRNGINLGIIAEYPWQIAQIVRTYAPDTLLIGWDERAWTFPAFRAWWSVFSLRRMMRRHNITIIAGVAQSPAQIAWAHKIGIATITADMHPVTRKLS